MLSIYGLNAIDQRMFRVSLEPDPQPRLSEDDFVAGLEAHTARAARHCERASVAHDAGAMLAAVVQHTKPAAVRLVRNVRMAPGDGLIGIARSLEKRHVVGSHQPVPVVSNLRTAADIDAYRAVEGIRLLFGRALEYGRTLVRAPPACASARAPVVRASRPARTRCGCRVAPVLPRLGLERDRDVEVVDRTRRRAEARHDAIAQRQAVGEDGFEACPRITRWCEDRERDGVERKDPAAAAARLDFLLHRLENGVNDLERLARHWPHEPANRAVECTGQPGFEVACFSQEVHVGCSLSGRRASPRVQGR